ncbi:MAG: hypothetical protein WB036_11580 [Pseudolabrys sp.]
MLFLTRPFWGFRDLIPYALAKRALAEISHASTSAVSTAAATAGLPFTAKILAATTALPHAHFVPVVVLSRSAILLAVMRLVREMTALSVFAVKSKRRVWLSSASPFIVNCLQAPDIPD